MRRDSFATYHPSVNFFYFCSVIFCSMFLMHPAFLAISFCCSLGYALWLGGKKTGKFFLSCILPFMLLVALINPAFNHRGVTILCYLWDNPITLESILYGLAMGVMFGSVLLWFSCYNKVMTSDKFIYLFGRMIPALSLVFAMVLRFVPKFQAQFRVISQGQQCIGRDLSQGNLLTRARNGLTILSILTTWALENAIDTSDSMRSRGYGLKGRTSFGLFRITSRDKWLLLLFAILLLFLFSGFALGQGTVSYFPSLKMPPLGTLAWCVYCLYLLFCLIPLILALVEEIKWRYLQSLI